MVSPNELASEITNEDLGRIRRKYGVPPEIVLTLPRPEHRVSQRLEDGVFFYEDSLKAGLRFPLHPLVKEIMRFYNICPTMVAPNSWRSIIGFISMCHQVQVTATLPLFRACYHLIAAKSSEWSFIGPRRLFRAITDKPSSIKEWKVRFFIVGGNVGSDFPVEWGNYVKDPEAQPLLSAQEEKDFGVLSDGRSYSAGALLSEESLFVAGLSPIDPRGKSLSQFGLRSGCISI